MDVFLCFRAALPRLAHYAQGSAVERTQVLDDAALRLAVGHRLRVEVPGAGAFVVQAQGFPALLSGGLVRDAPDQHASALGQLDTLGDQGPQRHRVRVCGGHSGHAPGPQAPRLPRLPRLPRRPRPRLRDSGADSAGKAGGQGHAAAAVGRPTALPGWRGNQARCFDSRLAAEADQHQATGREIRR